MERVGKKARALRRGKFRGRKSFGTIRERRRGRLASKYPRKRPPGVSAHANKKAQEKSGGEGEGKNEKKEEEEEERRRKKVEKKRRSNPPGLGLRSTGVRSRAEARVVNSFKNASPPADSGVKRS
jgi:hypothetical protein